MWPQIQSDFLAHPVVHEDWGYLRGVFSVGGYLRGELSPGGYLRLP